MEMEAFAQLLRAPRDDAQFIIRDRFPVPRLVVCDQHGYQARFLLAKLKPSSTYNNAHEMAVGSDVIFDSSLMLDDGNARDSSAYDQQPGYREMKPLSNFQKPSIRESKQGNTALNSIKERV